MDLNFSKRWTGHLHCRQDLIETQMRSTNIALLGGRINPYVLGLICFLRTSLPVVTMVDVSLVRSGACVLAVGVLSVLAFKKWKKHEKKNLLRSCIKS